MRVKQNKQIGEPEVSGGQPHNIGVQNEKPLHFSIKEWYRRPGDLLESPVAGSVIDIVRGNYLIEIQTKNFFSMKGKLNKLLCDYQIRLVYPIARDKWILKNDDDNAPMRRKSPKHGCVADVFSELVSIPHLVLHPNFSLDILIIQEEEVRNKHKRLGWRRGGWVTRERRLLAVLENRLFKGPQSFADMLPSSLISPFTTLELAQALGVRRWLAQKAAYCLRVMETIKAVGKRKNAIEYVRCM